MNPQQPATTPQQVPNAPAQKPKNNVQQGVGFITRWVIQDIVTTGAENYTRIPQNAIVIFAAAQLQSDADVFVAAQSILSTFDVVIATNTTPKSVPEQVIFAIARFIAGANAIFTLPKAENPGDLPMAHPKVFEALLHPITAGKAVIIATSHHIPEGILAKEPAIEPVYLAQLAMEANPQRQVVIVPVATTLQIAGKKRSATVSIGVPLQLGHVDVASITTVLKKKPNERTPQDYDVVKQNAIKLRQQGSIVMQSIATLLPPEKRGIWGQVTK